MCRSKRHSLRFICEKREVVLRTAYEEGTAVLVNISTKGCALIESSLLPEVNEIILISFDIPGKHGENARVEIQAEVLRLTPQLAMRFTRIEPETKSLILNYFISESRELKNRVKEL